uniref:Centrosomal protein kizuna n=1 Tax=Catagonus wagneri TaxID=51154 RepID=A0A8C3YGU3_9CETA
MQIEYETQIKKMQLLSKESLEEKSEVKEEDGAKVVTLAEINLGTAVSRGLYQPATIFMGRQMSAVSSMGDFSTGKKSPQPTKNFSIPDPHSHRQSAQRSDVTDSYVVQTNSDTQCLNKSDKTDGKTSLQIGEKMPVTASALSEEEQSHCSEIESGGRHSKSHLSEGRRSAGPCSPLRVRLSPKNRTSDLKCDGSSRSEGSEAEILTREHIEVEEERARPPVPSLSASECCASESKCSQEKHDTWEAFSDYPLHRDPGSQQPFRKFREETEEEHSSSSSDLTVSISEDDLILESPEPEPNPGNTVEGEDGIEALNVIHSEQERDALSAEKQNCIVQTLSSPDSKKESSANLPAREVEQASGLVRTRSGQHVATLTRHDNSFQEEAASALWKDLPEDGAERLAVCSRESSCSSPSTLDDSSGVKDAEPALWLSGGPTREEEVSNDCREESAEESEGARMPITETKAYQMLKQSTLQDSARQHEAKSQKVAASASQLLGLNVGSGTLKTKTAPQIASEASFSSSEGSPLSRHENKKNLTTNLKSKAFWGESDDSNSEIEAALRPRNHNTSTDDFDDFYDL